MSTDVSPAARRLVIPGAPVERSQDGAERGTRYGPARRVESGLVPEIRRPDGNEVRRIMFLSPDPVGSRQWAVGSRQWECLSSPVYGGGGSRRRTGGGAFRPRLYYRVYLDVIFGRPAVTPKRGNKALLIWPCAARRWGVWACSRRNRPGHPTLRHGRATTRPSRDFFNLPVSWMAPMQSGVSATVPFTNSVHLGMRLSRKSASVVAPTCKVRFPFPHRPATQKGVRRASSAAWTRASVGRSDRQISAAKGVSRTSRSAVPILIGA